MMQTHRGQHAMVLGCTLALVIGGWATARAHDGNTHAERATPVAQQTVVTAPAPPLTEQPELYRSNGRVSDRFPNILLRTQNNQPVRFYDDLVKDRIVIINFMYTTCYDICPGTTGNLVRVHKHLGSRVGRDILMLSISIDPQVDTPDALQQFAARYGSPKQGWLYLTGDYNEIEALRRQLGVYDLDPVIDADKTQHSGIITFGNDRTDRWAALPALMNSAEIARTVLRITRDKKGGRFTAPSAGNTRRTSAISR